MGEVGGKRRGGSPPEIEWTDPARMERREAITELQMWKKGIVLES